MGENGIRDDHGPSCVVPQRCGKEGRTRTQDRTRFVYNVKIRLKKKTKSYR